MAGGVRATMMPVDCCHAIAYYTDMGQHSITGRLKSICLFINLSLFGIALFQYFIDGPPADIPELWITGRALL